MPRIARAAAAAAILVFIVSARPAPGAAAPAAPAGGEAVDLRLRPKPGDVRVVTETSEQQTTATVGGREVTSRSTAVSTMTITVERVDPQGNARVRQTYDAVRVHRGGPDGPVVYDSTKPRRAGERVPAEASLYAARLGNVYTFPLSPAGRVTAAEVRPRGAAAAAGRAAAAAAGKPFGEAGRLELEAMFVGRPDRPAAAGASWHAKAVPTGEFQTVMDATYTLKGARDGAAEVEMSAEVSPDPRAKPVVVGRMTMESRFTGRRRGTFRLDVASGWPRSVDVERELDGVSKMTAAGAGAGGGGNAAQTPTKIRSKTVWEFASK